MKDIGFVDRFPEFANADPHLVEMVQSEAMSELNRDVWGELYLAGVYFLAADKLARSPMGEPVRLIGENNKTTYGLEFERLCRSISMGARVA
jgi:hypothetical protein